jgi:hypothetical protein
MLAAALVATMFSATANAKAAPRSYAVLSLVGNAIHIYTVRPEVGTRTEGESRHVLAIAEQVFDTAALHAANAAIKQVQPDAKVVLMMTQDAGLYAAQNAMFEAPGANQDNRNYLIGLLKERAVSHLVLVTTQRDHAYFKLTNGSAGTGLLEGLGFYIDDTTHFRNTKTFDSSRGMLGPFAYIRMRLLDATTLALVKEVKATRSSIVTKPSSEPSAMEMWTSLKTADKISHLNSLLGEAVTEGMTPLLGE